MHKNTKGSGGPQTSSGKAIVSKNAMKSGVYSTARLLPDESALEYENVKNSFWEDLQPQDFIEEMLVNDLSAACLEKDAPRSF
jgi:hypothetical protein